MSLVVEGEPANGGLNNIQHIVVLMLENRSFDHMLGYLSLSPNGRKEINGLTEGLSNEANGIPYPVKHLTETHVPNERWDPDHSAAATDLQIGAEKMDGFAQAYLNKLTSQHVANPDPGVVMGYFDGTQLPVYDHLAEHFCVCDQWHSSVPGATWPNRLYAVAGSAAGSRDDQKLPLYDKKSFVRHLDHAGVSWRWYSYDIGTLRCVDRDYLLGHHERFAYVQKLKLSAKTDVEETLFIDEDGASFLEDAARGRLPSVSWIDPNFKDLNLVGSPPNDDHPPSDVEEGQELVMLVYNALASSPAWNSTVLLVLYDEHGGFYDHVVPPKNPPDDNPAVFSRYGIRVPALVVSPWVGARSVAKDLYDHTSVIKTILMRFCPPELDNETGVGGLIHWLEEGHPHYIGKRVASARDLGALLSEPSAREAPDRSQLVSWVAGRHQQKMSRLLSDPGGMLRPAEDHSMTDLETLMLAAETELHRRGHPPGQP